VQHGRYSHVRSATSRHPPLRKSDAHAYAYRDSCCNTYGNSYGNGNIHAYTYCDENTYSNSYFYPYAYAYSYSDLHQRSIRQRWLRDRHVPALGGG